jgi:hypothetical protein
VRGALAPRLGDQERRGVRRRRAQEATGRVGDQDGGRRVPLLHAAAARGGLRRLQGARGEGLLLPLAGPCCLLRLRMARPPIQLFLVGE